MATGELAAAYGLRPAPLLLGAAYAAMGLGLSLLFVGETAGHARHEAANHTPALADHHGDLSTRKVFALVSSAVLLGAGTAMVYQWSIRHCWQPSPTSPIPPGARGQWASTGSGATAASPVGALLAGVLAGLTGILGATQAVAALTAAPGLLAAVRMYETHARRPA